MIYLVCVYKGNTKRYNARNKPHAMGIALAHYKAVNGLAWIPVDRSAAGVREFNQLNKSN